MSATSWLSCGCTITRCMFGGRVLLGVTPCLEHVGHPDVILALQHLYAVLCSLQADTEGANLSDPQSSTAKLNKQRLFELSIPELLIVLRLVSSEQEAWDLLAGPGVVLQAGKRRFVRIILDEEAK